MPKLTLMVGPPGSGKSSKAKQVFDTYEYVNQDSQGKHWHMQVFQSALHSDKDVVVDRMNFSKEQRDRYLDPAKAKGYETEIVVIHEPYKTCLDRCLAREGHETIKDEVSARAALATFFGKYERVQDSEADKITRIWPEGHKSLAVVCDLDGTLCNVDHRLHFVRREPGIKKDWKSFFENISGDSVNYWCADILTAFGTTSGYRVIYCSGRPDNYRKQTIDWLKENDLYDLCSDGHEEHLYMRPRNDSRDDSIVKEIILDFELLTRFTPYFMIDDRKRVYEMWRRRGFTCLACANGDF